LIEHIITGFAAAGVRDLIIVTGYRGEQIETAVGDGARLGVRIIYRRQTAAEGTARALLLARDALADQPFALSWGDILVQPEFYAALVQRFRARPCDALLALNAVDDPWAGAAVYVDDTGRVSRIIEKPRRGSSTTRWNNAGVFVFDPLVLDYAARLRPSPRNEYELPQAIAAMIADDRAVYSLPIAGYWSDVGTPDDLRRADREFPVAAPHADESPARAPLCQP
jgi:dTDP-glucose pyrophosphorylase